jgi:hypothetical protein
VHAVYQGQGPDSCQCPAVGSTGAGAGSTRLSRAASPAQMALVAPPSPLRRSGRHFPSRFLSRSRQTWQTWQVQLPKNRPSWAQTSFLRGRKRGEAVTRHVTSGGNPCPYGVHHKYGTVFRGRSGGSGGNRYVDRY